MNEINKLKEINKELIKAARQTLKQDEDMLSSKSIYVLMCAIHRAETELQ